jgi:hypothetical protein
LQTRQVLIFLGVWLAINFAAGAGLDVSGSEGRSPGRPISGEWSQGLLGIGLFDRRQTAAAADHHDRASSLTISCNGQISDAPSIKGRRCTEQGGCIRGEKMTVRSILDSKGRDVVTMSSTESLASAIKTLGQHRIGAVVISDGGGRIGGILSERDVVRAIANKGAAALDLPISAVMTTKVQTCSESATVTA